jgi:hypothetical protein
VEWGKVVRPERFELPACCSGGNRSIQLSYGRLVITVYMGKGNRFNHNLRGTHRGIRRPNSSDDFGTHWTREGSRSPAPVQNHRTR